ncbi:class II aldolase/adducin family protein [Acidisphaera sp. L21]|jgi:L-fuculose-phosphate aldolase|uniref:class II aldolase/adducin family protein n=1 Tax=Acidisphaera sp. L21 TaxID=1641851 RepID=UPI00131B4082|nr:class II aldolase/adducin family protein [Acidisphaera sp. L21]
MTADPNAIAFVYRELARLGLNNGSSGNVSQRSGAGMLITPSGTTAETVTPAGLVQVTLDGQAQSPGTPSSEAPMHAAIYAAYPQAGAIVHTHADYCTALACLGEDLPPFHYMVVGFGGGDVRCAPYTTFGTPALAESAVAALQGRSACLLANHGMICHGRDPATALSASLRLETLARQYLLARSAGSPRLLTPTQIEAARERYKTYGSPARG